MRRALRAALRENMRQGGARARMLARLGALLDDLSRHADGARGDLAEAGREHLGGGGARARDRAAVRRARGLERLEARLRGVVDDEEQRGARRAADEGGADAPVNSLESAGSPEAALGLQAGLDGVEGKEESVNGCASDGTGL